MYGPTDRDLALMCCVLVVIGVVIGIGVPALWHWLMPLIHAATAP